MTNLAQAMSQVALRQPPPRPVDKPCERKTAKQMAKHIFHLAATSAGYTMKHGYEKWGKLWLKSPEFVLMEIDITAAASPHLPRNPERVAQRLLCSAEEHEPVVVEVNKRKVGKTMLGYIPEIIYLDGKHRIQAQSMQGRTRTWAWVGTLAASKLKRTRLITKLEAASVILPKVDRTKMAATYELHATTVPSVGMPVTRQDSGEGGSRPTTSVVRSGGPGSGRHKEIIQQRLREMGQTVVKGKTGGSQTEYRTISKLGRNEATVTGGPTGKFKVPYHKFPDNFHGFDDLKDKLKAAGAGGGTGAGGMGGPGASNTGGSGFNPTMKSEEDCSCKKKMNANSTYGETKGARSSGQLADPSASDTKVPQTSSDAGPTVRPSDRREWLNTPNDNPPGSRGWGDYGDPAKEQPGAGVGPRVGSKMGDTKSEERTDVRKANSTMRQPEVKRTKVVRSAGKKVEKIWNDDVKAVAPPGREQQVLKLKKKFGEDSSIPFKIAWDQHGGKKKMKSAKGGR